MTRLLAISLLATAWLASLSMMACGGRAEAEKIDAAAAGAIEMGIDPDTTGNTASTIGTGGVEKCVRVNYTASGFDGVSDYNVDVVVFGDTLAPQYYNDSLKYDDTSLVHIAAPGTDRAIKMPGGAYCSSDALPDSDGTYGSGCSYLEGGPGTAGDGTLVRVGLDIDGTKSGVVTFTFSDPPLTEYASGDPSNPDVHPLTLGSGQLAINTDCPGVTPTPTPGTPTATPTSTPLPTPPPGTIMLVGGWNNACYVGPEQPIEEALADVVDHVLAVYRMRADQGFDTWFPDRPEASNITTVSPYQPLFILMGQYAFWPHEPSGTPPPSVSLARGWNSVCYTGQTKSVEDATASVAGGLVIMYQFDSEQGWRYFVPARPEMSNIAQLSQYDTVLMLVNQEGGTTWTFDP